VVKLASGHAVPGRACSAQVVLSSVQRVAAIAVYADVKHGREGCRSSMSHRGAPLHAWPGVSTRRAHPTKTLNQRGCGRRQEIRRQRVLTRALVRSVLAKYVCCGVDPAALNFGKGPHGKPCLEV
jgi:hypothetical protein